MIKRKVYLEDWKFIIYGVLIGIVIHGFMLVNDVPNWDDLRMMYVDTKYTISEGRWFLLVPTRLSGLLSMNWFNGLLSIIYISISAWLVSRTLTYKSSVSKYLLIVVMLSFPTVSSTLFYTQCADGFFFALLLISISAYLINGSCFNQFKFNRIGYVMGILTAFLSLGTYQAYFPFGCAVLIISLILHILTKAKEGIVIFKSAIKVLIAELISLFGYVIFTKVFFGDLLRDYMGISSMGEMSISDLLIGIKESYKQFFLFYFADNHFLHQKLTFVVSCSVFICLLMIIWHAYQIKIHHNILNIVLLSLLIIAFPLGSNLIYAFGSDNVHMLMKYGLVALFILEISILDLSLNTKNIIQKPSQYFLKFICLFCMVTIGISEYKYILNDNMAYYSAYISYEQTYAYAERLVTKIESVQGFTSNDQVLLMGAISYDVNKSDTSWMVNPVFGSYTGLPTYLLKTNTIKLFLNRYLGSQNSYELFTPETYDEIDIIYQFQQMPNYPDDGSIVRMDNGMILVKLSE